MSGKYRIPPNLNYLHNKPKRIHWKVIAGPPDWTLDYYQTYDLIFDDIDLKIRGIGV